MDIHRTVVAFSISHDHNLVRLYAHYLEIDGEKTFFYRYKIKQLDHSDGCGERWTCHTFTCNIYEKFIPVYLVLIKRTIDQLPDPVEESFESALISDEESALSSQGHYLKHISIQEGELRKPHPEFTAILEMRV